MSCHVLHAQPHRTAPQGDPQCSQICLQCSLPGDPLSGARPGTHLVHAPTYGGLAQLASEA
jgi:hypothetical protein